MKKSHIKPAVRRRDGYRCTVCGMTQAEHLLAYEMDLDVHRLVPGSPYSLEGCVTVCRSCHGSLPKRPHGYRPENGEDRAVNCHIPQDVYAQVAERARQERRSVAQMALILLESILAKENNPGN